MAQKTIVVLEDDLDGGPADETVSFALDGTSYEIDLTASNAAKLRDAFAAYVGAGRKSNRGAGSGARRSSGRRRGGDDRIAEIRSWAKSKGLKVNERGRIPGSIIAQWESENR